MSVASSQQIFLANSLLPRRHCAIYRPRPKSTHTVAIASRNRTYPNDGDNDSPRKPEHQLLKLAMVTLAAGVLTLGSIDDAYAAKSGGRIGGQAFRSSAPKSAGPRTRINNSRTNIYVNPPVAPPLVGGYGFGYGVPYYGGWGWSPFSFFAPGPGVAVGVGGGFEFFVLFVVLGAVAAVVRRFRGPRDEDDDY